MAKRTSTVSKTVKPTKPAEELPRDIREHVFFGLTLDEEQADFVNAILDDETLAIFANCKAGTGKTTMAVCAAVLLVEAGLYDKIVYCMHSVGDAQGYLPGTITEKSEVWFEGLYQALLTANRDPQQIIINTSIVNMKNDQGYIKAVTDTYLRGSTIGATERTIFIIDEAQNFDEHSLRKTLTRANDNSKVIVIGHTGQIDLPNKSKSGFWDCMAHFKSKHDSRFAFCELKTNHRGYVSTVADEGWVEIP